MNINIIKLYIIKISFLITNGFKFQRIVGSVNERN